MKKILLVFLLLSFILLYGCSIQPSISEIPKTDKSSENVEQIWNLYRNKKYDFRIKFPEGWKQEDGDGVHVLKKAVKNNSSIIVMVQELPKEYISLIDENMNMKDLYSLEEFKETTYESIIEKFNGAKMIDYGEINIDNIPAYWLSYETPYSTMGVNIEGIMINYQIFHKNYFYTIVIGSSKDEFISVESILKQSISTFVFED